MMNEMPGTELAKGRKPIGLWLLTGAFFVLVALNGLLGWQLIVSNRERARLRQTNTGLQLQVDHLKKELAKAVSAAGDSSSGDACDGTVSTTLKDNIKAAMDSGNYAALQGSMAASVHVIIAASEGVGDRTPAQAVGDLAYLGAATPPWDFSLPAATITAWSGGFYSSYFDSNTYTGRSNDGRVIVFDFNDCGQISEIFMAIHQDLLS